MGTSAMLLVYDFENDCWFCEYGKVDPMEVTQFLGSMNKGQQAYYIENNSFSNSINNLGLGIKTDTNNYSYRILSPMNPVQNVEELKPSPLDENSKITFATPKNPGFKSYMGIVWTFPMSDDQLTTNTLLCKSSKEEVLYPSTLVKVLKETEIPCPPGFEVLR
jgi:hypothetical protein